MPRIIGLLLLLNHTSSGNLGIVMKKWICLLCGFVYDEEKGLPHEGIPARTRWEDIPSDWQCPDCGVGKANFKMMALNQP